MQNLIRSVICLALVSSAACAQVEALDPVPLADSVRTVIVLRRAEGEFTAAVVERDTFGARLVVGVDDEVWVLGYEASAEILQLPLGPLPFLNRGPRGLPEAGARFGRSERTWLSDVELPSEVAALGLPALDVPACYRGGGCVEVAAGDEQCTSTCDGPAVVPPAPPELPRYPTWTNMERGFSEPVLGPSTPCPRGTRYDFDAVACVELDRCGDEFRAVDDPNPIYVRRAEAGGDGTQAAPFGLLAQALAEPGARTIVLAPGNYVLPAGSYPGLRIVGQCATGTQVFMESDVEVSAGALALSHLRLLPRLALARRLTVTASVSSARVAQIESSGVELATYGVSLTVEGSRWEATEAPMVTVEAGDLDLSFSEFVGSMSVVGASLVTLRSSRFFGSESGSATVSVSGPGQTEVEVTQAYLRSGGVDGFDVRGVARTRLEDVVVTGDFRYNSIFVEGGALGGALTVRGLHIEGGGDQALGTVGVDVDVEDYVVRGDFNRTLVTFDGGQVISARLHRIFVQGAGPLKVESRAVSDEGAPVDLELDSFTFVPLEFSEAVDDRQARITLIGVRGVASRIFVQGAPENGIDVGCAQVGLQGVEVAGAQRHALALSRGAHVTLERFSATRIFDDGLCAGSSCDAGSTSCPQRTSVLAGRQVSVHLADANSAAALDLSGAEAALESFDFEGGSFGVKADSEAMVSLRSGRIAHVAKGLQVSASLEPDLLDDVVFVDVDEPLVTRD